MFYQGYLVQSCPLFQYQFYYKSTFLVFNVAKLFTTSSKSALLATLLSLDEIAKTDTIAWPIEDRK